MILEFNINIIIKNIINKIFLVCKILLIIYINFKLFYNCFMKFDVINKKRLMIDIIMIWKVYKKWEIIEIKWINKEFNFVDVMIKLKLY